MFKLDVAEEAFGYFRSYRVKLFKLDIVEVAFGYFRSYRVKLFKEKLILSFTFIIVYLFQKKLEERHAEIEAKTRQKREDDIRDRKKSVFVFN